jgi:hypothetical protein
MYFQYAKIHPHLQGFRRKMNLPDWMQSIEKVVEGSAKGKKRLTAMHACLESMRRQNNKSQPDQPTSSQESRLTASNQSRSGWLLDV